MIESGANCFGHHCRCFRLSFLHIGLGHSHVIATIAGMPIPGGAGFNFMSRRYLPENN
jgi:hypothetical protein